MQLKLLLATAIFEKKTITFTVIVLNNIAFKNKLNLHENSQRTLFNFESRFTHFNNFNHCKYYSIVTFLHKNWLFMFIITNTIF